MVTLHDTKSSHQTHARRYDLWVAVLLLLIPVGVFWYVWSIYAVNVPKWDDHVLKTFLVNLNNETSISGKLYQFFKQHNEHRIVYDRLITWLDFHLFGKFSYLHLMLIGNLSLVGLVTIFGLVLAQSANQSSNSLTRRPLFDGEAGLVYLPPVAYLLLNLSHWENMFWGMAALQNFTVIFWVFGVIYLLAYTQKIGAALLVAIVASLTSGNGLLVWPVGFAILLLQTSSWAKSKNLLYWGGSAIAVIALYFWGYAKPEGNPPAKGSLLDLISGWMAFTGSAAEAFPVKSVLTACIVLGGLSLIFILGICLNILKKWLSQRALSPFDSFVLGSAVFLVGTGAVVAWTRAGFGANTLITSRYKLYSVLTLALIYVYMIGQTRALLQKIVAGLGLVFSLILMGSSYRSYQDDTIWWRQWLLTNQFNWTYTTNKPISTIDANTAHLIDNSPAFYDASLASLYSPASGPSLPLSEITKTNGSFTLGDSTTIIPAAPDAGSYILLRSSQRLYLFQTTPIINQAWRSRVGLADLFKKGFSSSISESAVVPATYQVERLIVQADGAIERHPTGQTITAIANSQAQPEIKKNW
ncbi:hypothetical protein [Spirosoma litoris]